MKFITRLTAVVTVALISIFAVTSCQNNLKPEDFVELEFFLPYLSDSKTDSTRAITSSEEGNDCHYIVDFKHQETKDSFTLTGDSGETLNTGKIKTGIWVIEVNAYLNNVLEYSAVAKTELKANENKTVAFSFSKVSKTSGSGSEGSDGGDSGSAGNTGKKDKVVLEKIDSNVSFTTASSVRADTTSLVVNLDGIDSKYLSNAVIALYDSNNNLVAKRTIPEEVAGLETKAVEINAILTVGTYYMSIYQGTRRTCVSENITVYAVASIIKAYVPDAGISYAGSKLPVTITGANFKSTDFDESKLVISGDAVLDGTYTVLDNTRILCAVTCPDTEGLKTLTATYDDVYAVSVEFNVYPSEKCIYNAGDIIMNDGTVIPSSRTTALTSEEKTNAVAIVGAKMYGGGTVLGCAINFSDIMAFTSSDTSLISKAGITSSATYDGYQRIKTLGENNPFGKENLDYITQIDVSAAKNFDSLYPVFAYAENYGSSNNLTGDYAQDWYVPSQTELYEVMQNHTILNKKLALLGKDKLPIMDYFHYTSTSGSGYSYYNFYYLYTSTYADDSHVYVFYIDAEGSTKDTDDSDNPVNCDSFGANGTKANWKYAYRSSTTTDLTISRKTTKVISNFDTSGTQTDCYIYSASFLYYYYFPRTMPVHLIKID